MKNIKKYLYFGIFSFLTLTIISCDDKDNATGDSTLEVTSDVVATIQASFENDLNSTEVDEMTYTYTVTLNKPQSIDVHIAVSQIDGNADSHDYEFDSNLVIPAYSTSVTGHFKVLNDAEEEGTESFTLQISDASTANVTLASKTFKINILNSCVTTLDGVCNYVTTNCYSPGPPVLTAAGPFAGTVTFTALGKGVYSISDASFGGWKGLYGPNQNATGVQLVDNCNKISYAGKDQYGEVFTFSNLVVSGLSLTFHWANDYGEYGDTTLTRVDGKPWPNLSL